VKRVAYWAALLGACATAVWAYRREEPSHPHMDYLTGWCLLRRSSST
jgi:hypothetical protein